LESVEFRDIWVLISAWSSLILTFLSINLVALDIFFLPLPQNDSESGTKWKMTHPCWSKI
jgi:hypothetical protein